MDKIFLILDGKVLAEVVPMTFDPDLNTNDLETLENRIQTAITDEDYRRAAKIKKYIEQIDRKINANPEQEEK